VWHKTRATYPRLNYSSLDVLENRCSWKSIFVKIDVRYLDLVCSPIFITHFLISWPVPTYRDETSGWRVGTFTVIIFANHPRPIQRRSYIDWHWLFYEMEQSINHSTRSVKPKHVRVLLELNFSRFCGLRDYFIICGSHFTRSLNKIGVSHGEVRVASRGQEVVSVASQGDRFKCISCVPQLERDCISCVPGCQPQHAELRLRLVLPIVQSL
jgi:hypothetical protein